MDKIHDWLLLYCKALDGNSDTLMEVVMDEAGKDGQLLNDIFFIHSIFDSHESFIQQLTAYRLKIEETNA